MPKQAKDVAAGTAVRWPALMTKATAAEYLGISERTLGTLVAAREVPTVLIGVKSIRYPKEGLDEWIQSLPHGQTASEKLARRPRSKSQ